MYAPQRELSVIMPNLAIFFLVAIGLLSNDAPLHSIRPVAETSGPTGSRFVTARLWQDPLSPATLQVKEVAKVAVAVQSAATTAQPAPPDKPAGPVGPSAPALDGSIVATLTEKTEAWAERDPTKRTADEPARVLLLGVLVTGGPYPEDGEVRLRTRYAVLSALGRAQYVPRDPGRLRVVEVSIGGYKNRPPLVVPIEEFDVRFLVADGVNLKGHENTWRPPGDTGPLAELEFDAPFDRVVVLWLNETELMRKGSDRARRSQHTALDRIEQVCDALVSPSLRGVCTLRILGPSSTDALLDFVQNTTRQSSWAGEIYCSRATAAKAVVQISSTREGGFGDYNIAIPDRAGKGPAWPVCRTVATDDTLVDALLKELHQRRVAPGPRSHIVLVGEWDSLYSRGLGRTIAAQLLHGQPKDKNAEVTWDESERDTWSSNPKYFHEYSYLRGLDGLVPQPEPSDADSDDAVGATRTAAEKRRERAEGPSQVDYLRRLEDQLASLRNRLLRDGEGDIGAIGVVGSDIYDKLMVLRALRRKFSRAVFFTTDMDALYLDPSERAWARNLLIVSPFGLAANGALQGRIPPFRDSYQTALFLTTLKVLGLKRFRPEHEGREFASAETPLPRVVTFALSPDTIRPRIFEVGRSGAHELAPDGGFDRTDFLHPSSATAFYGRWNWFPTAALGLIVAAALFHWLGWSAGLKRESTRWRLVVHPAPPQVRRRFLELVHDVLWLLALTGLGACIASWRPNVAPAGSDAWKLALAFPPLLIFCGLLFFRSRNLLHTRSLGIARLPADPPAPMFLPVALYLLVAMSVVYLVVKFVRAGSAGAEPFFWFEGISLWPTEIMRLGAMVLGAWFLMRVRTQLRALADIDDAKADAPSSGPLRRWTMGLELGGIVRGTRQAFTTCSDISRTTSETAAWAAFRESLRFENYFPRVFVFMVAYLMGAIAVVGVFGFPAVPGRGAATFALDQGILGGAIVVHIYLLFYVFDATVQLARLVQQLTHLMRERHQTRGTGSSGDEPAGEQMARITELASGASRLIYYPFTILFILIVSRNSLFDNWDWPISLLVIFGSGLVLLIGCTVHLQQKARAARSEASGIAEKKILQALEDIKILTAAKRSAQAGTSATSEPGKAVESGAPVALIEADLQVKRADLACIQEHKRRIDAIDDVTFRAWHHNPLFRAALIPIGGLGSLTALEQVVAQFSS